MGVPGCSPPNERYGANYQDGREWACACAAEYGEVAEWSCQRRWDDWEWDFDCLATKVEPDQLAWMECRAAAWEGYLDCVHGLRRGCMSAGREYCYDTAEEAEFMCWRTHPVADEASLVECEASYGREDE